MNYAQIVDAINAYQNTHGGANQDWYVGITADPQRRLFEDHNVDRQSAWLYRQADTADVARIVEATYHDYGYSGGPGGGGDDAIYVYAYRITVTTRQ